MVGLFCLCWCVGGGFVVGLLRGDGDGVLCWCVFVKWKGGATAERNAWVGGLLVWFCCFCEVEGGGGGVVM